MKKTYECNRCGVVKLVSEFPKCKRGRGFQGTCKACKREWMRNDRKKYPEKYRAKDLKSLYGITSEIYNDILREQGGVCAICGKEDTTKNNFLHIDHNHRTGEIRGLLCSHCNLGLGNFMNDEEILYSAIKYLRGDAR